MKNLLARTMKMLALFGLGLGFAVVPVSAHTGNGWPNHVVDANDYPCQHNQDGFGGDACSACDNSAFGMVRWRVSEPYLTLWLHDEPFAYSPSQGEQVALRLSYKQRSTFLQLPFSSFGTNWGCRWFSYIIDDPAGPIFVSEGAAVSFQPGIPVSARVGVAVLRNPSTGQATEFLVWSADGAKDKYGHKEYVSGTNYFLLTDAYDRHGFRTQFHYENDENGRRVSFILDCDGKSNSVSYAHSISNLVTSIRDPYGRVAQFQYDTAGHLTNIVDVATNSSGLAYDPSGLVTNLTTPYGNTSFKSTQSALFQDPDNTNRWVNLGGTNLINRSLEITEPNGSKQLYLYRDDSRKLNPTSSVTLLPASFPLPATGVFSNLFEDSDLFYRNSFHWNRRQYAALSTAGQADYSNLSTNDYQLARMKHWLSADTTNGAALSDTLSMAREPSPDGYATGQMTWFDYAGQSDTHHDGTNAAPQFTARLLPDGTSWFSRAELDAYNNPTNLVSTYSVGGTIYYRTNDLKYSGSYNQSLAEFSVREGTNANALMRAWYSPTAANRLLYFTNALGEMTIYKYDQLEPADKLTGIIRPSGLSTTNFYFASGDYANWLQQIVDYAATYTNGATANRVRSFTYTNGLVQTYTDPRGLTVTCTWDSLQRLTGLAFPDNTYLSNRFDKLDLVATKDRLGHWRYFSYNALGQLTAASDELGRTNFYGYCDCGSLSSVTNALGQATFFDFDYAGRLKTISATNGTLATYQYNALGQVTNVFDGAGKYVRLVYNNQGLLTAISNAFGRVLAVTYDHRDRATNVVSAAGVSITNAFDNLDRLLTRGWPDGGIERFVYSERGLVAYTNQLGKPTLYGRDAFRRLTSVTNANQDVIQASYSPAGDLLTLLDGKQQKTAWAYDLFGLLTAKTNDAGALVLTNGYDANWRLTARWTPAKGLTTYGYDDAGNLTSVDYPASPDVTAAYDALNRLTNLITAGLFTNHFSYTNLGAWNGPLAGEDGPWPDDTVSYGYANQQRTSLAISGQSTPVNYAYDAAWRLTNVTSTAGAFGYKYSPQASPLIAQLTLPGGSYITNTFDSVARLTTTSLKNNSGGILNAHTYGYDLAGQRFAVTNNTGNYALYGYDEIGQLTAALAYETNGTARLNEQLGYAFDAAGNLRFRTNNALVQTFTVDSLNQLTTATRTNSFTVAGNTSQPATNVTVNGLTAARYADTTFAKDDFTLTNGANSYTVLAQMGIGLNATNTLTVNLPATNTFAYDANGNLRTNGPIIYDYDDENRLITNWVPAAWKSEHVYDGLSRRRLTREYAWQTNTWVKTNETRYVYDGRLIVQERNTNNAALVTYTRGLDLSGTLQSAGGIGGLLARTGWQGSVFYHHDGQGNVTALVDIQQTLEARYLYDPFGNLLGLWGPLALRNTLRFSGKPQLPAGIIDFGFRFYDPNLQRWLNQDPLGEWGGMNLYGYVGNNPLNNIDPYGLADGPIKGPIGDFAEAGGRAMWDFIHKANEALDWALDETFGRASRWVDEKWRESGLPLPPPLSPEEEAIMDQVWNTMMMVAPGGTKIRCKTGPKLKPHGPHNAKILSEAEKLKAEDNTIIAGGGGKEKLIPTPGGLKGGRRPDILYETPSGEARGRNIGKTKADGTPVPRETDALNDLNGPGGLPTDFVPYDK